MASLQRKMFVQGGWVCVSCLKFVVWQHFHPIQIISCVVLKLASKFHPPVTYCGSVKQAFMYAGGCLCSQLSISHLQNSCFHMRVHIHTLRIWSCRLSGQIWMSTYLATLEKAILLFLLPILFIIQRQKAASYRLTKLEMHKLSWVRAHFIRWYYHMKGISWRQLVHGCSSIKFWWHLQRHWNLFKKSPYIVGLRVTYFTHNSDSRNPMHYKQNINFVSIAACRGSMTEVLYIESQWNLSQKEGYMQGRFGGWEWINNS